MLKLLMVLCTLICVNSRAQGAPAPRSNKEPCSAWVIFGSGPPVCDGVWAPDEDGDGFEDPSDNCPKIVNVSQRDMDADGLGDSCDVDIDGDGIWNELDICPENPDPRQIDSDGNGIGDFCDFREADEDDVGCQSTSSSNRANYWLALLGLPILRRKHP